MTDHNAQFDITAKTENLIESVSLYATYVAKHGVNSIGAQERKNILKQTFWFAIEAAYLAGVNDGVKFKSDLVT